MRQSVYFIFVRFHILTLISFQKFPGKYVMPCNSEDLIVCILLHIRLQIIFLKKCITIINEKNYSFFNSLSVSTIDLCLPILYI